VGGGEKLLTYLNSALKVLSGLDIFVEQCNSSFERVELFRYLGTAVTNKVLFMKK
jgi:hypothetical protein